MIVMDTASYSHIIFGLLTLAGFTYAPKLADLSDGERHVVAAAACAQSAPPDRVLSAVRVPAAAVLSHGEAGGPDREPSSRFGHFCASRVSDGGECCRHE